MKFIHILFALAIVTSCSTDPSKKAKESKAEATEAATPTADGPVVSFDKLSHDFGTINEGDVVETVFTLTNTGNSDLIILNARGSCGCTVPDYPKDQPIAPGDSAEVTVKFDSNNKPNANNRSVTFTTNTEKGREVVQIRTFVTPDPLKEQQREARRQAMQANQ
ncbi:MAG: DUF1573 domain-containing protein [Flavobacteriaceae bacterium]|jgi:hypothetical protein